MEGAIWREWGTARTYQRLQTISSSISSRMRILGELEGKGENNELKEGMRGTLRNGERGHYEREKGIKGLREVHWAVAG